MSMRYVMAGERKIPAAISVASVVGDDAAHPHCPKCGNSLEHRPQFQIWACGDAYEPHFTVADEIIQAAIRRERGE